MGWDVFTLFNPEPEPQLRVLKHKQQKLTLVAKEEKLLKGYWVISRSFESVKN